MSIIDVGISHENISLRALRVRSIELRGDEKRCIAEEVQNGIVDTVRRTTRYTTVALT